MKQGLEVAAVDLQQGFVLTRHWRDTPAGTLVEFWLATDAGPRHIRLPCQPSVAFIPAEQRALAEALLRGERDVELRPLELCDFHHRPVFAFLSAGVVNVFVPSGGGQWAVQGPIMLPAAQALGVSPAVTAMAIAWGDAWTNIIQPFWALPLLGIVGLGARDIMGYCLITLLYSGVVISGVFYLLA